jgi:hypothetical protein
MMKKNNQKIARVRIMGMSIIFLLISAGIGNTQAVKPKAPGNIKRSVTSRELQGEITWIHKDRIAVVYSRGEKSEEEILLPIAKDVKLENLRSLDQLSAGDSVAFEFAETLEEVRGEAKVSRIIKKIRFIRKGAKKEIVATTIESPIEQAEEEGRLIRSQ